MATRYFFLFLVLLVGTGLSAQDYSKQKAKGYFLNQRYEDALATLNGARDLVRADKEAQFLLAICHYHLNNLEEAGRILRKLSESNGGAAYPECWLYRAKVYHAMHQFERAAGFYKDYLRSIKPNHPNRGMVRDAIQRCALGMSLMYQPSEAAVENLGAKLNSGADEFAPIASPNRSRQLYFSAIRPQNIGGRRNALGQPDEQSGKYHSDIYTSSQSGGQWAASQPLHHLLNSPQHDVLLDFNVDGSVLYYFKGWSLERGQILVDTFQKEEVRELRSDPFPALFKPALGDQTPHFAYDTLVYFASARAGGYGGLDLYKSTLRNGQWSRPENLGPTVNTPYDETTPFLARDGRTLYFSTNHSQRSIGGLDVVKSVYNDRSRQWTIPENAGLPINSAADDAYFRLTKDGFTAYFSSSRKDGYGQRDIYGAYFNRFLPEMELPINYVASNRPPKQRPTTVKPVTDVADNPGSPATLPVEEVPTSKPNKKDRLAPILLTQQDAALSTADIQTIDQLAGLLREQPGTQLLITAYNDSPVAVNYSLFDGVQRAEEAARRLQEKGIPANRIYLKGGTAPANSLPEANLALEWTLVDGQPTARSAAPAPLLPQHAFNQPLHYKVQVFSLSGAPRGELLSDYPDPMVEKQAGGSIYRYTVGAATTYAEALRLQQKLRVAGRKSAFVVPYINGVRVDKVNARAQQARFPDLANYLK